MPWNEVIYHPPPHKDEHQLTLLLQKAQTGLLTGYEVLPEERTAMAGFCTVRVAPNGYTKLSDLYILFPVIKHWNKEVDSLHWNTIYIPLPWYSLPCSSVYLSARRKRVIINKSASLQSFLPINNSIGNKCLFGMKILVINSPRHHICKNDMFIIIISIGDTNVMQMTTLC